MADERHTWSDDSVTSAQISIFPPPWPPDRKKSFITVHGQFTMEYGYIVR